VYVASFTGGKATSNLYKQADLSSQFTSPAHLLPEVLTSGESTTLASIHHVPSPEVARSCEGHTTKAPWCVRHPVCVLAPVEPFHSHSHCLLPPPFFQLFLWLCVFVWCLRVLGSAIYVYTVCWQCARKSIWENRSQLVAEWSRAEARPIKRKLYSRAKAHNTVQGRNGRVAKLQQRFASCNFPKVKLTEKTPLKQGWIE